MLGLDAAVDGRGDVSIPVYHHTPTHLPHLLWGAEEWVGQNKPQLSTLLLSPVPTLLRCHLCL